ncbi:hypothetical protein HBI56_057320 [Parastagonospora nodorum]|nr:hypothetical protein HBH53_150300 [Parastagonospora nodorum]KAH3966918.1 hypothetical protein HBH51_141720 [Parastagonospora nodorum]KAH4002819.1 hypothetical protein HBI10_070300 [Parastagonospora nodorum]KAH4027919.1 hypothetical protein HBI13_047720 [Parastagonospora nodorum]KAH4091887.1 hypothetical protein HBH46_183430 [Parastagonospora nodorum]
MRYANFAWNDKCISQSTVNDVKRKVQLPKKSFLPTPQALICGQLIQLSIATTTTPTRKDDTALESFRFLNLPTELRLMVYERITVPVRVTETHFEQPREDET